MRTVGVLGIQWVLWHLLASGPSGRVPTGEEGKWDAQKQAWRISCALQGRVGSLSLSLDCELEWGGSLDWGGGGGPCPRQPPHTQGSLGRMPPYSCSLPGSAANILLGSLGSEGRSAGAPPCVRNGGPGDFCAHTALLLPLALALSYP
jgi:hypothetical protein